MYVQIKVCVYNRKAEYVYLYRHIYNIYRKIYIYFLYITHIHMHAYISIIERISILHILVDKYAC